MTDVFTDLAFTEDAHPVQEIEGFEEEKSYGGPVGRVGLSFLQGLINTAQELTGGKELAKIRGAKPIYEPQSGLEKALTRGTEAALSTAALGGTGVVSGLAGIGGVLGQGAEEAGLGGGAQFVAEVAPFILAPLASGKVLASKSEKPLVDAAKRLGLNDKEIAPLIRGKKATSLGRSFVAKPSTREKVVERTRRGVDGALNRATKKVVDLGELPQNLRTDVIEGLDSLATRAQSKVGTIPSEEKAVGFLRKEAQKIARKELTGKDLSALYRSLNKRFGATPPEVVRDAKELLLGVMEKASPSAASDYRAANELFSRLKMIEAGPGRAANYMDRAELYGLVSGIAAGHPGPAAAGFAVADTTRRAFTHVMTGPRGQRLAAKVVKSVAEGKPAVAQAAAKRLLEDTQKEEERLATTQ